MGKPLAIMWSNDEDIQNVYEAVKKELVTVLSIHWKSMKTILESKAKFHRQWISIFLWGHITPAK